MTIKQKFEKVNLGPWVSSGMSADYRLEIIEGVLYIFFQQTKGKKDWTNNFRFVPYKNMQLKWYAHKGFTLVWKSIRDEVIDKIKKLLDADLVTSIEIVGYSHGAALATLAHEDIGFTFKGWTNKINTTTFGGPRVVWLPSVAIKERFKKLTRYKVRGDIVTLAPFILFLYGHVGNVKKMGPISIPWIDQHRPETYLRYL
jgi:hypothetical protein